MLQGFRAPRQRSSRTTLPLADVLTVQRITSLGALDRKGVSLYFARDYPSQRLRSMGMIVVGSKRSNPWVEAFEPRMTFRMDYDPATQNGYSERWEFGVQHELPAAVLLEADYAGNHAVRFNITRNLDWVQRQFETAASDPALRIDIDKSSLIRGIRGRPIDAGR